MMLKTIITAPQDNDCLLDAVQALAERFEFYGTVHGNRALLVVIEEEFKPAVEKLLKKSKAVSSWLPWAQAV